MLCLLLSASYPYSWHRTWPLTLHDRCMFRFMIMFALWFAIAKAPLTLIDRCMFRFMIIFVLCFTIEKAPLTLHDRCMFRFMIIFALCFAIEKAHWWGGHIPPSAGADPTPPHLRPLIFGVQPHIWDAHPPGFYPTHCCVGWSVLVGKDRNQLILCYEAISALEIGYFKLAKWGSQTFEL
jgi:hypothetical protein